jgi:hypothetical protein
MDPKTLQTWLPLAIIAVVFAIRFHGLKRARPFRPGGLLIAPLLLCVVFGAMLLAQPPGAAGWAVIALGLVIGAGVGWKRGHLMQLERDPRSGLVMVRQSPAALLLILGILVSKRALAAGLGIDPASQTAGHAMPAALLLTDGMLGFALGMVIMLRWTLWQRAKAIPPHKAVEE